MTIYASQLRVGDVFDSGWGWETVHSLFEDGSDDVIVVTRDRQYRFDCMVGLEVRR